MGRSRSSSARPSRPFRQCATARTGTRPTSSHGTPSPSACARCRNSRPPWPAPIAARSRWKSPRRDRTTQPIPMRARRTGPHPKGTLEPGWFARPVLRAAHCLYSARTRNYLPASSFHFLVGYDGDQPKGHALGLRFVVGPGFDPTNPMKTPGSDWALLTLDTALGTVDRRLTLLDRPPDIGATIMISGYSQDRRYVPTAGSACRIIGWGTDSTGQRLLHSNCTGTHGVSGAPVLVQDHGIWRVAGVDVAAEIGVASGHALLLDEGPTHL